jgi:hypothetical protein
VFVTGETKSDWYVRSSGEAVYPRPELVDEYRRFSDGHNVKLMQLADLLSELNAPTDVVREVRQAEEKANTETRLQNSVWQSHIDQITAARLRSQGWQGRIDGSKIGAARTSVFTNPNFAVSAPSAVNPFIVSGPMGFVGTRTGQGFAFNAPRRILVLGGVTPLGESLALDHMNQINACPFVRLQSASFGAGLHLEYDRNLTAADANLVLSHAQLIDPTAAWASPQETASVFY